jgi:hypothetical protein
MVLQETDQKIMSFEQLVLRIPGGKDGVRIAVIFSHADHRAADSKTIFWP